MADRKNISDMSFEEFFGKSKPAAEGNPRAGIPGPSAPSAPEDGLGFGHSVPKINYKDGKFTLYVPRFKGKGPFNMSVDCSQGIIPITRLDSAKIRDYRLTFQSFVDLSSLGINPLDTFTLTIDGEPVYVNKERNYLFFNSSGMTVNRAAGEIYAVSRKGFRFRLSKASLLDTVSAGDLTIAHYDVSPGGSIRAASDDKSEPAEESADPVQPAPESDKEPKKEAKAPRKAPARKTAVKASASFSPSVKEASVSVSGSEIPLYSEFPSVSLSATGCEPSECSVWVEDSDGEIVFGKVPGAGRIELRTGHSAGLLCLRAEKDGKALLSEKYFLIPDFTCKYQGKGDIPADTSVTFGMFGESFAKDIYDDDFEGPYSYGDISFKILWNIPVITYDLGEGPRPYEPLVFDADDIRSDMLVVKVRGARKKKIYFGPEFGKREDVTKDWDSDSVQINLSPLMDLVYSSTQTYCFYISVNSFPIKKFIEIHNPERISVAFRDGNISADVSGGNRTYVCRIHLTDKTFSDHPLTGEDIQVPKDAVEAEVLEYYKDDLLRSIPVKVRALPFVCRISGDYWLYVSKDKRIPVPDALIKNGTADMAAVAEWHAKITRMNPELKTVTLAAMKSAFSEI
ncbi:MAG: hypothetical protein J5494_07490 [Candidatus Methanomethylophilaceae archaeon]|nr:hypothetical protein [Candidatus Methanomethylophilaceae archaeon]